MNLDMNTDKRKRNYWLYVLKLEQEKYYVGVTSKTPEIRMQEHLHHKKSAYWTQKYRPIELIARKDLGLTTYANAEEVENKVVRDYMHIYGYNNVRGGDLSSIEPYVKRFNRFFLPYEWEAFTTVILLMLLLLAAVLNKYFG